MEVIAIDIPVQSLEACTYDKLASNSKVFNLNTLEYFLWIHLPEDISRHYELFQVDQIAPNILELENFNQVIKRECRRPWLQVTFKSLDLSIGMHTYRLQLINKCTDDVVSLYFCYIIQNDNPEKPYVYMENARKYLE